MDEEVLKYILHTKTEHDGKVFLYPVSYSQIPDVSPNVFVKALLALETKNLIKIYWNGTPGIDCMCQITLLEAGLSYFSNKAAAEKEKTIQEKDRKHKYRIDYISLSLSIVAIIISVISIIVQLSK